jgi:PKHD-type hydroxylase
MNLNNYYWCFKSVLTPRFCDDVINYANSQKEVMARTGDFVDRKLNKEEVKNLQRKRKSDLVWLNDAWIYKEVIPYVKKANINAGWNFEWDESEHFQFTKYKLNQFYDWHCDSFNKTNENGKIRKLSVTCHIQQAKNILTKGSIIVFPSFVWHRVKPVTEGTRYSLVLWNLGKPYK